MAKGGAGLEGEMHRMMDEKAWALTALQALFFTGRSALPRQT
jgi:hypothetical protein